MEGYLIWNVMMVIIIVGMGALINVKLNKTMSAEFFQLFLKANVSLKEE